MGVMRETDGASASAGDKENASICWLHALIARTARDKLEPDVVLESI